jgi:choline-sulfatase
MPTTLELAGIDKPSHVEFHSLLPLLEGGESPYDAIYGCYLEKQRSIRTDRYKLIAYPESKTLRLYDIKNDPQEISDLAGEASMKSMVEQLFGSLTRLQHDMNDDLDLSDLAP